MSDFGYLPPSVQYLIDEFNKLPGIGPKTAARLAFYILRNHENRAKGLSRALLDVHEKTRFCPECFNITEAVPCSICTATQRNQAQLCVVSDPLDIVAIERAGEYKGVYHVLHGEISPVNGVGPERLKIAELLKRVAAHKPTEIILATNPTMEGETTAIYIAKMLQNSDIKMTRIARGLPSGGDLEYADDTTLSNAFSNRLKFQV